MNRIKIVSISLLCAISLFFTGCLNLFTDSDEKRGQENFSSFINCLSENNLENLKSLFAKNKIAELENLDGDINELFVYFKGDVKEYKVSTPSVLNDSENNKIAKWLNISADVETTEEKYRFSICWCDTDTDDSENEGIWSLYVFNYKDNPLKDFSFYGEQSWIDLQWQVGINIVKPYKYAEMTLNIIESGNIDYIKLLFSTDVINSGAFEESVSELKSYYNVKHTESTETASKKEEERGENGQVKTIYEMRSYEVKTESGNYYVAVKYCDKSENIEDTGIRSFYIKQTKPLADPYWGDGLWTKGINIDVN